VVHPRWLDEKLIFISDRTNWWNLYLWDEGRTESLCPTDAEFCPPQAALGQRPYAIIDDDHLLCSLNRSGEQSIEVLRISDGKLRPIAAPGTAAASMDVAGCSAVALLSYPDQPAAVAFYDLDGDTWTTVRSSTEMIMDAAFVSRAQLVRGRPSTAPSTATFTHRSTASAGLPLAACRR
jgi:hypothetical protein